jgi:hypothetical protein
VWQFWGNSKKDNARENALHTRLAEMDARITCVSALAFGILKQLPDDQRRLLISGVKGIVGNHIAERSPQYITEAYRSAYRNELSQGFQIFIQMADDPPPQSN